MAVITTVDPVHLMIVRQRQAGADPHTKATYLARESASRLLESTSTIAIYYCHSAQKRILILSSHKGQNVRIRVRMQQRSTEQRSTVDSRRRLKNFKMLVSQSVSAVSRQSV